MNSSLTNHTKNALQKQKRKKRWQKVLSVLAAVVVFVTTYMLILPAITLENNVVCGKEEHTHTEDCYTTKPETKELTCTLESLELHKHTSACYGVDGNLICGIADYVVHTHDDNCYDENRKLVCILPEVKEHEHTEECYDADGRVICDQSEVIVHEHDDNCYDENRNLICGKLKTIEHEHTEECFTVIPATQTLVCEKEEHEHTEECYDDVNDEPMQLSDDDVEENVVERETVTAYALENSDAEDSDLELASIPSDTGMDFSQYITGAIVQKIVNGKWTNSTEFENGDQVRVTIEYSIPAGIITSENRTIHYQLPNGVLPNESLSGRVYWKGQEVGDYYIDESGLIVIVFDESFANGGEAIEGDIYFEGTVSSDNTEEDVEIQFGGDGGTITIKKEEEAQTTGDINVKKETTSISEDKKTISYKVTIGTNNGTGREVKFEDWLTNGTFNLGSIKIQKIDEAGNEVSDNIEFSPSITDESSGQQHLVVEQLPELQAGEKYVITYTVISGTAEPDGKLYVTNSASANGVNAWNETKISETVLSKTGYYNEDTGKITWKVTINPGGKNLNGYTLSDTLDGVLLENQSAILKNEDTGYCEEITLPYQFKIDTTSVYSYTIEYETAASDEKNKITNNVRLVVGDEDSYSTGTDVWISQRDWDVSKSKNGEETDSDGNQKYTWQTNITLPNKNITGLGTFTYTDTILTADETQNADIHYGTVGDITKLIAETLILQYVKNGQTSTISFKNDQTSFEEYISYELKFYDADGNLKIQSNDKVTKFEVIFTTKANADTTVSGKTIYFKYPTTGVISGVAEGETITFKNSGEIPNHTTESSTSYEKPQRLWKASSGKGVLNYDGAEWIQPENDSNWNSYREGNSSVELGEDGIIYYRLILKPENSEAIILNDILPEGVTYVENSGFALYCSIGYNANITGLWPKESANSHDFRLDSNKPVFSQNGTDFTITIPEGYYSGNTIAIFYAVSVDKDAIEGGESKAFVNSVTWGNRTASTTTNVTKEKEVVVKNGKQLSTTDSSGNKVWLDEVEYNVVINPSKDNLDINCDTLTLYDTLTYSNLDGVYLDLSNVQLYTYDPNNTSDNYRGELIDTSRYQVTYNNTSSGKQVLTVTLPDELACVLTYRYTYDKGSMSVDSIQLNNEVSLIGKSSKVENLELKDNVSGATANKAKIKIYKVDSEDYSKLLSGAEFQLSSYHFQDEEGFANGAGWKEHTPYLVTTENGEFELEADSSATTGEFLRANTLYKLVEKKAPAGYSLSDKEYYFVWLDDDTQSLQELWNRLSWEEQQKIGDSSNIQVLGKTGGNIYIPNEYTSVGVKKVWLDQNGVAIEPGADEIKIQLIKNIRIADGYHVTIKFDSYGNEVLTKQIVVKKGTSISIIVQSSWNHSQENEWSVTKDEQVFGMCSIPDSGGYPEITTEPITEDNCVIVVHGYLTSDTPVTINVSEPDYTETAEKFGDPVTLNAEGDWSKVWNGLEKTDADGNSLYYTIEEITSVGSFITSYTNNDGIQNGEIIITNTKEESSDYTLPETGGSGTIKYIMGGILLMLASVLLYIKQHIKEGRRKHIRR